jgi:hypothetical protein
MEENMQDSSNTSDYYGFFCRLLDANGDVALFNQALDLATRQTKRRSMTNRDFLMRLVEDFIKAKGGKL